MIGSKPPTFNLLHGRLLTELIKKHWDFGFTLSGTEFEPICLRIKGINSTTGIFDFPCCTWCNAKTRRGPRAA